MQQNIRVKLTTNLTQYHPSLLPGLEGLTIGQYGKWSRHNDRFIGVKFPATTLDVLWESLEIIDKEYLAEKEKRDSKTRELLKNAKDVVITIGPKGGFKSLSYKYLDESGIPIHASSCNRKSAAELTEFFKKCGIEVKEDHE